ncbi:MAG: efflux RND transporter permease subunit [Candidatus Devosia phytovorans]|uniref:Efflux RND transporter permease subunit n=1 Tax=Candidatus Devosia phytovorans TaxID=3121372 RepID=A0AAJ5VVN0_9HYPH|nr:efflux RND transporter permease subunit [Devosia sp.]WEK04936.1 MAG: efflux RND transporter permease subunit [Devosia sp.]
MNGFNLSDWALRHRSFVWFLILISLVAGGLSYMNLGREEDPSFTIKQMVIVAALPGATAEETLEQVTRRIENKLQELDSLKQVRSETFPGQTVVYVEIEDSLRGDAVDNTWLRIRNMMNDIRGEFPSEFAGFQFNDNFGDVFGSIYAFTSDGFTPAELREEAEDFRDAVLLLDAAGKVELVGTREQQVHIEFSTRRLAALGLDRAAVMNTLAAQNAIVPSGVIRTQNEQIAVRVSGRFSGAEDLANAPLRVDDAYFTLADVATVTDGYNDPPSSIFRYDGQSAIGVAVGMREGSNIIDFGTELDTLMASVQAELPIGMELHKVADQPHVVDESVNHFVTALVEAVVIVLIVSFLSLGLRAGLVVTMTIPLVLAITFVFLDQMGVTLQRISLGALIIALGLLVDDAMIAIETMISRIELGESKLKAASYAWTSIAFPMLSGTLVTVAGFIPIGLNSSQAGEYTVSLFYVIAISLVVSWVVAVLFAPLLGVAFLPAKMKHHAGNPGRFRRGFHRVLRGVMRFKWATIIVTVALFAVSMVGMRFVENQFFPSSDRPELVIDVNLRQNSTIEATDAAIAELETFLSTREEAQFYSSYAGRAAPRFILSFDAPTAASYMGQVVVMTDSMEARDSLAAAVREYGATLQGVELYAKYLELGPPVGRPVQYRISGPDRDVLLEQARSVAALMGQDPRLNMIAIDQGEPVRVARVVLDQEQLRQMGLTQSDVAQALYSLYDGVTVTELSNDDILVDVIARGIGEDRGSLEALQSLQLNNASNVPVPLGAFARLEWETEAPVLHQRDRVPTITVKAAIVGGDQAATIVTDLTDGIQSLRADLPAGYEIVIGGSVETSGDSQAPILAVVPIMLLVILTLVMMQMQSFRLMLIVLSVAPLGLIGVVAALLASGAPLGFVAILGVLALGGILIRNSVILVHEIQVLIGKGQDRWNAVFHASDSRARPILLTAAAASLALIPISRQVFWGPMAFAMMGGIIVGTVITLLFVPALYCAVFGVRPPEEAEKAPAESELPTTAH